MINNKKINNLFTGYATEQTPTGTELNPAVRETTVVPTYPNKNLGGIPSSSAGIIQQLNGTQEERQLGIGGYNAPLFFKDQNGDGKITRADVIKARTEGYKK